MVTKQKTGASGSQSERFAEAAKALECDESEERFDEALKKVARHKPTKEVIATPSGKDAKTDDER
ncbi:hypothetical protein [Methylocystis parvus]|uniref:hypothetical protein n=1 Tax=Methylocystis parvus TaxID=134 RepID=UPI003C78A441